MMHDLVKALLPIAPYVAVAVLLFLMFALVYLFRAFKNEPEKTRLAVALELSMLRNLGKLFTRKTDTPTPQVPDTLADTISQPIKPPVAKP